MKKTIWVILLVVTGVIAGSCKKESFITGGDAEVSASDDSLHFDTIFTTKGSTTKFFKLFNNNDRKLRISSISLGGGAQSSFKINADGFEGPQITDLEMAPNDSLYVFVTVAIDPTAANLPFILEDSIGISFNGNEKWVRLSAWGQNANFLTSAVISSDTEWTNEKPYVITGGLLVDENAVLTIQKGTKIYLHADAPVFIDGTIRAIGEKYDSTKIIFAGDRTDDPYRNYPAAWPGLYFREKSKNNLLQQVVVKNAYQGIVAEQSALNGTAKLTLRECVITNCYDAGIMGIETSIDAVNCLITNCGKNIVLTKGGVYHFTHCTDAAYSNHLIAHKQPVLSITNFLKEGEAIVVADLTATFTNCIFWGDDGLVPDEVVTSRTGSGPFNITFSNCLWKLVYAPDNVSKTGMIENADPLFLNIDIPKESYDFHLQEGSPAQNSGAVTSVTTDLEGNPREPAFPDIGAYELAF